MKIPSWNWLRNTPHYKAYDYNQKEMSQADSWLAVRQANDGFIIDMTPRKTNAELSRRQMNNWPM